MGKKSKRNKAPKAARERRDEPEEEPNFAEDRLIRYRDTEDFNIDNDTAQYLALEHWKADGGELNSHWKEGELETMTEFMYLVVFPAYKKSGLEAALRLVKRWPKFKPYWRRLRRRVCDYCGKMSIDLSEPRLGICSGCGVARYCDEECQAHDFSHHEDRCYDLARRWDGVGPQPTSLFPLVVAGTWNDPAALPSARARERLVEWARANPGLNLACLAAGKTLGKGLAHDAARAAAPWKGV